MGMKKQQSFASAAWNRKGKVTRRERFLAEMDAVIPWPRLVELIEPHYPNTGKGRPPHDLERMLRIYFLQQWFNLSDPQAEDAIYDSESMRRFAAGGAGGRQDSGRVDDPALPASAGAARLTEGIFEAVKDLLAEHRLTLRAGTIVDATIIAAPSSTKNATGTRDPEMKQTRKGKNWHFGMKLHIGTDRPGPGAQPDGDPRGGDRTSAAAAPAARRGERALRRPGVLEGGRPAGLRGAGRALSGQPAGARAATRT